MRRAKTILYLKELKEKAVVEIDIIEKYLKNSPTPIARQSFNRQLEALIKKVDDLKDIIHHLENNVTDEIF